MKAPEDVLAALLAKARVLLYSRLPERSWHSQRVRVERALTLPARWLDERKVEISAERYQAIVEKVLNTIRDKGRRKNGHLDLGDFPCIYLWSCVESHLKHHGDEYYEEGKGIRNLLKLGMPSLEKARLGAGSTVPVFAQVHVALAVGKGGRKVKQPAKAEPDLFL